MSNIDSLKEVSALPGSLAPEKYPSPLMEDRWTNLLSDLISLPPLVSFLAISYTFEASKSSGVVRVRGVVVVLI